MQLGDAGAEVTKIELLCGDLSRRLGPKISDESSLFMSLNRGKKSIAIDYTKDAGRDLIKKLMEKADVIVENFRPGEAEKIGLDYDQVRNLNPNIIYCSITPFGHKGPYANRSASELELQGIAGYLNYLGEPGGDPVRVGTDIAAMAASQFAFVGILTALYNRERTGIGQKLNVSMLGAVLTTGQHWMAANYNPDVWEGFFLSGQTDNAETGYKTRNGNIIFGLALGMGREKKSFAEFVKKIGLEELLNDPWWVEHGHNTIGIGRDGQELKSIYEAVLSDKTCEEMQDIIHSVGGSIGIIKHYDEMFNEPQVRALEMLVELNHPVAGKMRTVGIPFKLEKTPCRVTCPAPTLGQHTDEIMLSLGLGRKEITKMREAKIVA
jgi:crotonobetainyl-CoA:carnitine CoA-transferase CaiB-like acyl-CoA transferase